MGEELWKGTILVVDDTPGTIDMVKIALEEEGYEMLVATNGSNHRITQREYNTNENT